MLGGLWLLYTVRGVLSPFVLAILISALLEPGVKWLIARGWSMVFAVSVTMLAFFGTMAVALVLITPFLTQQVSSFKDRAQEIVEGVTKPDPNQNFFIRAQVASPAKLSLKKDWIDKTLDSQAPFLLKLNLPTTKRQIYAQYVEPQRGQIDKVAQNFVTGFIGLATGLISQIAILGFVPIMVGAILPNMDSFRRRLVGMVPPGLRGSTVDLAQTIGEVFSSYLRGVSIAVFGYMTLMAILLSVLGAPYGLILGILFGAVYLIPFVNVIISSLVLFVVTALSGQTGNLIFKLPSSTHFAVVLVVIFFVVHTFYDMVINPRVVGKSVGLDAIVSIFVSFSGGALLGLPGMMLAVPVAGACKVILDRVFTYTNRTEGDLSLPAIPHRHRSSAI